MSKLERNEAADLTIEGNKHFLQINNPPPKARSVSEWETNLSELGTSDETEVFKFILSQIRGYGIDNATNHMDADALDLLNAFIAWKRLPY